MKTLNFKVKATQDNGELFVEGWAVKYNVIDASMWKDKLLAGCCKKTLSENKNNIKLLFEHDRERVIGKIVEFNDSDEGLFIKAKISEAEPEIKTKISEGLYDSFSIGFYEIKSQQETNDKGELISNNISEIKLKEVSLVSFPAFKEAKFGITKSIKELLDNEKQYTETEFKEKLKSLITAETLHESRSTDIEPIDYTYIINKIKF